MPYIIITISIAIIWIMWFIRKNFKRITIFEYERGLKYSKGRFKKVLEPNQYWFFAYNTLIAKIDIRPKFVSIIGQEVLSSDGVSLKVSIAAKYEIIDPNIAINKIESYQQALYLVLQLALREIIGSAKIDELLEKRNLFNQKLQELTTKEIEEIGLKLLSADIKDIMFTGELKKVFAQVVKARQEGLAALEKARGESAALRNLLNAAKLMENNPSLMQLRLLQLLGETSGHTLILEMSPTNTPLIIKEKKT